MKLGVLKTQALRHLALGEHHEALRLYRALIRQVPTDLDARMKVADVLVHLRQPELACRVYAAVAWCDLQAGRPLHALVCGQAMRDLGQDATAIHDSLVALYGAGSSRIGSHRRGGRLPPVDPEQMLGPLQLDSVPAPLAAQVAAEIASDTSTFSFFPPVLAPIPLLSELSGEDLGSLLRQVLIRRVGPRTQLGKQGAQGYALLWVASGLVEAFREGPPRQVLARLGEGELFGERALLGPMPAPASLETCEPTDLIELPVRALRQAAAASPGLREVLDRLVCDRLLRQLLGRSPVFSPLTAGQRLDLLRRATVYELPDEALLHREGEALPGVYLVLTGRLEAIRGVEPFETLVESLGPGDAIGEADLLRPQPITVTLRAAGPVKVALLPREAFDKAVAAVPSAQRHLQALPSEVLRELSGVRRSVLVQPGAPLTREPDEELRTEFPLI
ncbi:MAG: cyclic nucleotide-binding domain-containing protein [Myxococcales bacterium]|nr:cyclic nucleotide-binding domain-containing protein [Myxococcota bacterium]MDW8280424.1 cyclic nucleotide-binding domain-containing protein [Myxococcales bacterium]